MPKNVTATRQLKATPERVFRAWTDPGNVSFRFAGVSTFASGTMLVMHKRPSRRGSTISGNRCTSLAAVCR